MQQQAQTLDYGQLSSPISPDASWVEVGGDGSAAKPAADLSAWPQARAAQHGDNTFAIGGLSLNPAQKASAAASAPGAGGSSLHARRKSTSEDKDPSATLSVPASSKPAAFDLSQPYVESRKAKAIGWEPVSPGILDRSPEVVAQQKPSSYYAQWPAEALGAGAGAGASSSAASSSLGAAPPATSAAQAQAMFNRRGSKASELQFPVAGLDSGMQSLTGAEFKGLLKSALKSNDLATARRLLTAPLPNSVGTIHMCLRRHRSGMFSKLFPSFECFLEEPQKPFYLMSAKKRSGNRTSNYTISLLSLDQLNKSNNEAAMTSEDPNYLGKLRSNFSGSEFTGYDAGINPKTLMNNTGIGSGSRRPSETKMTNIRQELCTILYENNIMSRQPRKFKAIVPGMLREDPSKRIVCKPLVPSDSLLYQYKALIQSEATAQPQLHEDTLVHQEILVLHNKEPVFENSIQAFCLNFHGRATQASVKNFQLVNCREDKMKQKQDSKVHLQFGKMDKDLFTMDVQYPLSIVQAFEISLAGLDTKLVCD